MSLLEQDTTKKEQEDQTLPKLEKFEARNNKEYRVQVIINSVLYNKQANNQILGLYYLIF